MKLAEGGGDEATVCQLHIQEDDALGQGEGVLFGLCQGTLPPSRAFAWARTLLSHVEAHQIIVEETIPVSIW
jgi:hypothetical protein